MKKPPTVSADSLHHRGRPFSVVYSTLSSGFNMLRFSSYQKLAVWGAILILVMVMNYLLEKMRERRNIKKNLRKTQCQN